MFKKYFEEAAHYAAVAAENLLQSDNFNAKKNFAVAYVVDSLHIPDFIRPLVVKLITSSIDKAVKEALEHLNN